MNGATLLLFCVPADPEAEILTAAAAVIAIGDPQGADAGLFPA